jgi:hydroxymethylglutaryl-CoA lyase
MSESEAIVCDVAPRDGLQNLRRTFSLDERVEFIDRLSACGLARIEAVSFVNAARVPAMADAEGVLSQVKRRPGTEFAGLVMNAGGADRALSVDLDEIRYLVVASETLNHRNQGATIGETLSAYRDVAVAVRRSGRRLTGVVGAAFGCPFEGAVPVRRVVELVEAFCEYGADEIVLADTIGAGAPTQVEALALAVKPTLRGRQLGFHFHNTRNTGYANAVAALRAGAGLLDASTGGLGGCPFAPRATGNIATEDLTQMLHTMGIETGIEVACLIEVVEWLDKRVPDEISGLLARAGLFIDSRGPVANGKESRERQAEHRTRWPN